MLSRWDDIIFHCWQANPFFNNEQLGSGWLQTNLPDILPQTVSNHPYSPSVFGESGSVGSLGSLLRLPEWITTPWSIWFPGRSTVNGRRFEFTPGGSTEPGWVDGTDGGRPAPKPWIGQWCAPWTYGHASCCCVVSLWTKGAGLNYNNKRYCWWFRNPRLTT